MCGPLFLPESKVAADQYNYQDNNSVGYVAQAHGQAGCRYEQQRERALELRQEKKDWRRTGTGLQRIGTILFQALLGRRFRKSLIRTGKKLQGIPTAKAPESIQRSGRKRLLFFFHAVKGMCDLYN